jgi:uncharacterized RDD family membrane protein YckC
MDNEDFEYAGFWIRTLASVIDTLLMGLIIVPIGFMIYGEKYFLTIGSSIGFIDFVLSNIVPAIVVILFWINKSTTPGKIAIGAKIVDAETGENLTTSQSIIRYIAYFISIIPIGLGLIWVGIDSKKQGWHDKIARTVVIRKKQNTENVKFR